jgi:hypothetical protein
VSASAPTAPFPSSTRPARQSPRARWPTTSRFLHPQWDEGRVLRRVRTVWFLLFFNVLVPGPSPVLHIPHRFEQVLTQGALAAAVVLALTINPRVRIRPNLYLGVFTLLGITSLMSSVRFVSVGTDFRVLRLLVFVGVLWLLTPWWGRRDLLLLRAQVGFLAIITGSVLLGLLAAPHAAIFNGRLSGAIWSIPPTAVADYAAVLTGLSILLWACGLMARRTAILLAVPSSIVIILTHTRTDLLALAVGGAVAFGSLFASRRRVRRAFAAFILAVALVGVPLSPLIATWLARGENASGIASLTGRTNFWGYVFAEQRNTTQKLLGDGVSDGAVHGTLFSGGISASNVNGLPIDSSWVEVYQDQGIVGDIFVGIMFVVLLVTAAFAPRGPKRALALFLVLYCLVVSFVEDGAGIVSEYAVNMTVAASLIVPEVAPRIVRWRAARVTSRVGPARPALADRPLDSPTTTL